MTAILRPFTSSLSFASTLHSFNAIQLEIPTQPYRIRLIAEFLATIPNAFPGPWIALVEFQSLNIGYECVFILALGLQHSPEIGPFLLADWVNAYRLGE